MINRYHSPINGDFLSLTMALGYSGIMQPPMVSRLMNGSPICRRSERAAIRFAAASNGRHFFAAASNGRQLFLPPLPMGGTKKTFPWSIFLPPLRMGGKYGLKRRQLLVGLLLGECLLESRSRVFASRKRTLHYKALS